MISAADRQALIDQNEAIRFPEQSFDPVPSSSTEKEESTGRRIHLKLFFDNGAESVNGKLNNLNIYAYLETVLLYMPDYKDEPEGIEDLMPWSEMIQQRCRIKSKS